MVERRERLAITLCASENDVFFPERKSYQNESVKIGRHITMLYRPLIARGSLDIMTLAKWKAI